MGKITGPSDLYKRKLARTLHKTKRRIWRDVADYLMAPQKNAVNLNLRSISRVAKKNDVIVVPGKILGEGTLDKSITIACYATSKSVPAKIEESGSKLITIEQLLEDNPSGSNVRIFI